MREEETEKGAMMSAIDIQRAVLQYKKAEENHLALDWEDFLSFLRREYDMPNPLPTATARIAETLFYRELDNFVVEQISHIDFDDEESPIVGMNGSDILTRARILRAKMGPERDYDGWPMDKSKRRIKRWD